MSFGNDSNFRKKGLCTDLGAVNGAPGLCPCCLQLILALVPKGNKNKETYLCTVDHIFSLTVPVPVPVL